MLRSHPEIEISFKFIPKILMSKECIHFFGPLYRLRVFQNRVLRSIFGTETVEVIRSGENYVMKSFMICTAHQMLIRVIK